jgi:hypothetical protein
VPNITVTEIIGTGTVVTVKFQVGGKSGSGKAFRNEYQKDTPAFEVGKSYDVEFEKKANRDGIEEAWIKKSKPKGGGGRAPDPEKAKLERERLDLDKEKQPLIMAQFILGQATQVAINRAMADSEFELGVVNIQRIGVEMVEALFNVHEEIGNRFKTS